MNEYAAQPLPPGASDIARMSAAAANLIPRAMWNCYGDIANALNENGLTQTAARGVCSALSSITPIDRELLPKERFGLTWCVPWERIRLADGSQLARQIDVLGNGTYVGWADEMWEAEGGRLIGGVATQARRSPLAAIVRREITAGRWRW